MTFAIEFDFNDKREQQITVEQARSARPQGCYRWVDFDESDPTAAREFLLAMGLDELTVHLVLEDDQRPRFNVFPSCLHFTLREARFVDGDFRAVAVDVVLGGGFMATIHRERVECLETVRATYREDFHEHARTHSFLLFELADHLTHVYRITLSMITDRIEGIESQLFGDPGDQIFLHVSDLIRDLLEFRKMIITAREIFHELATRRSPYISESTQPFLEKKGVLLERLSADVTTEREVLSEALNLYMGIVSHRTNKVVTRLTMISMVFLPLTFLAGVYGMNFGTPESTIPEIRWQFGYLAFWVFSLVVVGSLLIYMRRKGWL